MPSSPPERADAQRLAVHEESGWDSSSIASSRPTSPNNEGDEDEAEEEEVSAATGTGRSSEAVATATANCNGEPQSSDAPQTLRLIGAAAGDERRAPSDPAHAYARPSLKMTAHEFTEAKTIILDLLGWGVPPEYLVRCGVAREPLYYAFTELNLRLPEGFDTAGIVPYEPPASVKR